MAQNQIPESEVIGGLFVLSLLKVSLIYFKLNSTLSREKKYTDAIHKQQKEKTNI